MANNGPVSADRDQNAEETYEDRIEATFISSLKVCMLRKPTRWREAVQVLQTDPVFDEVNAQNLSVNYASQSDFEGNARRLFRRLSSGHKVVLLVLTKLVELSEEGTLIIIDEPEMHLHPPLIGSFVRALSELLKHVNGVAILATHSPIVLQEVPRCNVYKVVRNQGSSTVQRPTIETFGEAIGVLTSEVFGYEVENSGFHQLLCSGSESRRTL
ncbi:AAA family ATPase [Lacticaseibacillus paracasei]|uniref:AAA family ATPase n=1 Tax=Lacticaseibacillus paracasei TaxID=1597 RepID=UPI0036D41ED4